ncbi:MAG TPA: alpha/beta hydrolase [Blastocatellia bacterium]|nr:alpha/beta hydrolase [Blastocatellia bacterium]
MSNFVEVNGIKLHYVDYPGDEPALVLLPGLTANARSFDGLVRAGLSPRHRVLALDLRGRGLSDKPATGYAMADHAADVIGLLDRLGIKQAVVCGHSFGGLLALYLAAHYPERVVKLVVLDASTSLVNKTARDLIKPSLDRLGKRAPSWEAYLEAMKKAPFFYEWWDPLIENYFRADVEINEDGTAQARSRPENIAEAIDKAEQEDWNGHTARIRQPALLLHARGAYGPPGTPPIVPLEHAKATSQALGDCRYVEIPGNHLTMLFGEGARRIVEAVTEFIKIG